jgi:hypothetical protein
MTAQRHRHAGQLGQGHILLADRAYDSNALRETLKQQGAWARRSNPLFENIMKIAATLLPLLLCSGLA